MSRVLNTAASCNETNSGFMLEALTVILDSSIGAASTQRLADP